MCANAGLCSCAHLQAQNLHPWGAKKRKGEREREVGSEVSVATDIVSFLTT